MVKIYDVSNWQEMTWLHSGGTRAKRILQASDGSHWYFKCSERKPARDGVAEKYYRYEFWSEIIAYQLGSFLGLDILRYDVGYYDDQIGCLSRRMNNPSKEQLVEMGRYMTLQNPSFVPDNNAERSKYTFQLLMETIKSFNLTEFIPVVLKTILFDAIIGNTDRHQENWAFISSTKIDTGRFITALESVQINKRYSSRTVIGRSKIVSDPNARERLYNELKLRAYETSQMAPIYDSGSSLGRELTETKIDSMLSDSVQFENYILRGKSEIHWDGKKLGHLDFIDKILHSEFRSTLLKCGDFITREPSVFIDALLANIDVDLPAHLKAYKIPFGRKQLIKNIIVTRIMLLKKLMYGRL